MCNHDVFFDSLGEPQSNREYWLITEMFVYLHNGKDYCNCFEENNTKDTILKKNCYTCSDIECISKVGSYGDLIRNCCDKYIEDNRVNDA